MPPAPHPCLSCRERLAHCRGLCVACYGGLSKAVRAGKTTWAAIEAAGLALPAQPVGSAWRNWSPGTGAK